MIAAAALCLQAAPAARRKPNPPTAKRTSAASAPAVSGAAAKPAAAGSGEQATAARWLKTLTLRQKVAQLVVVQFNGHPMNTRSREYRKFVRLIREENVGGLILINVARGRVSAKADPLQVASFLNGMQKISRIPLLVSGDFERGASMRVDDTTIFPHAMAFAATGDPNTARTEGEVTAREARAMGVHWLFYPDADVNNNPENPIINIRSFGEDPADVSKYVSAFIEGAHNAAGARVLVTAKHFPGHGDTATDSHMNLATIPAPKARLQELEWIPFRAAIKSGVDSIMSAHIAVPSLDESGVPATLSPKILTGILRDELDFNGLVVTDALEMGGIVNGYPGGEAAVRALEAGADVLLMPPDPELAINAVLAAVKSGRLKEKRIDESAMRVLAAKVRVGLATRRTVDLERINEIINSPESNEAAQDISDKSLTLVKDDRALVPLDKKKTSAYYLLTEGRTSVEGQAFTAELRRRAPDANVILLDTSMPEVELLNAVQRGAQADQYVVAAFVSVAAYRGNVALGGGYPQLMQNLLATNKPVILVSLGNPYLLRNFPNVAAYVTAYSTVAPSEVATVKALFGEIPVTGKLPVTIPGFAKYGDGISLPRSR